MLSTQQQQKRWKDGKKMERYVPRLNTTICSATTTASELALLLFSHEFAVSDDRLCVTNARRCNANRLCNLTFN